MSNRTQAIVFDDRDKITVQEFDLPPCGPEEVVCETIYSFVSPGTELRVLSGIHESRGKFPLIPGYAWVGRVVEIGAEVKGWGIGELVTGRNPLPLPGIYSLWGGQAGMHRATVSGYDSVLKLPENVDPWQYVAAEVAAISWRGVTCAYPSRGETAVVIGQGLIGAFAALWLKHHGARVLVVDLVESRLDRARRWGVTAINANDGDTRERLLAHTAGGADIVIEASGSRSGVDLANQILRQPAARATNSDYRVTRLHSNALYWPRLVYLATYTHKHEVGPGGLSGNAEGVVVLKQGDRTVADRLAAIERIRHDDLPLDDIVTSPVPVEDAPRAYSDLRDHPDQHNTIVFQW